MDVDTPGQDLRAGRSGSPAPPHRPRLLSRLRSHLELRQGDLHPLRGGPVPSLDILRHRGFPSHPAGVERRHRPAVHPALPLRQDVSQVLSGQIKQTKTHV